MPVSEYVAARRLGLSVDTLRRDRRLGHLGIPFIKLGGGKRGLVRYDLVDLDRWVETKKQRRVAAPAPLRPIHEPSPEPPREPIVAEPDVDEPPVPLALRMPPRPPGPWEALIPAEAEDTDPFAAASRPPARRPGGYWSR
jgi:hypothetical protein